MIAASAAATALVNRAAVSAQELDGRHGDPSKIGNWLRERDLARAVADCVPDLIDEVARLRHEQKMIRLLALALLAHGRANECIEDYDDGAWVHGANCPGHCDYACGAMWIAYTKDSDECPTITAVHNGGTLSVYLPEWP